MTKKELFELTDREQTIEAKKKKSNAIMNAFIIGLLIGIVIYSVVVNSWGFLTLIPLYLIYKLINNSKKDMV